MSSIFANVLPVFILILVGWVLTATSYLKADIGEALGSFVFKVAVPVLLFTTLAEADFEGASPFRLWGAYFTGIAIAWLIGQITSLKLFRRDRKTAVVAAFSSCFSNLVFVGLPLVSRTLGHEGTVALSILLAVHLPVMMTFSTVIMEHEANKDGTGTLLGTLKRIALSLTRNPMIIAILAGAIFNVAGVTMPGAVKLVSEQIAHIAGPVALISLGMSLRRYGISGNITQAVTASGIKLILMPAIVLVTVQLFALPPVWAMTAVLAASIPSGVNAWLLANQFNSDRSLAASVITLSTALGVVTVSIWSAIIGIGG